MGKGISTRRSSGGEASEDSLACGNDKGVFCDTSVEPAVESPDENCIFVDTPAVALQISPDDFALTEFDVVSPDRPRAHSTVCTKGRQISSEFYH